MRTGASLSASIRNSRSKDADRSHQEVLKDRTMVIVTSRIAVTVTTGIAGEDFSESCFNKKKDPWGLFALMKLSL